MKRGFTVWELVVTLVILGVIAAILFPVFARAREECGDRHRSCQSNLKNIGLGFQQYLQDYDEFFPPAREGASGRGWVDSLEVYIRSGPLYKCPSSTPGSCDETPYTVYPRISDYFMNARLSGIAQKNLANSASTVINGEGDVAMGPTAPHYAISSFAAEMKAGRPVGRTRHLDGTNFGFADAHVKWFQATQTVGTASAQVTSPTFAAR